MSDPKVVEYPKYALLAPYPGELLATIGKMGDVQFRDLARSVRENGFEGRSDDLSVSLGLPADTIQHLMPFLNSMYLRLLDSGIADTDKAIAVAQFVRTLVSFSESES